MNFGVFAYKIFEFFILSWAVLYFYQIGKNKNNRHDKVRQYFAGKIKFFEKDKAYYIMSLVFVLMIIIRIVEFRDKLY